MNQLTEFSSLESDDLFTFVQSSRALLRMNQTEIGNHFGIDRSNISKFENGKAPPVGYVAGLLVLIDNRFGGHEQSQKWLLSEVNRLFSKYGRGRIKDWNELIKEAELYRTKSSQQGLNTPSDVIPEIRPDDVENPSTMYSTGRLFGVDQMVHKLKQLLFSESNGWIVAIEGAGGVGKTTLVRHIVQQPDVRKRFPTIIWISAKQAEFVPGVGTVPTVDSAQSADDIVDALIEQLGLYEFQALPSRQKQAVLRRELQGNPALIVLDNLEELSDAKRLLPLIQTLNKAGKFIVTSRLELPGYDNIEHIKLSQLQQADAVQLLRHLAEVNDSPHLRQASDKQLETIYECIGGNPLALRLVAGHIQALSLSVVLDTLRRRPDEEIDEFYTYLYQTLWDALTPAAQRLFTTMPLVAYATLEQLEAITDVEKLEFLPSLRHLVRSSLVDADGNVEHRHYSIHQLAETFLLKQLGEWTGHDNTTMESQNHQIFREAVHRNVSFWRDWYHSHRADVKLLDRARAGFLKAIEFGLLLPVTRAATYQLIDTISSYMEQCGQWNIWNRILLSAEENTDDGAILSRLSIARAKLLQRQGYLNAAIAEYCRSIRYSSQANDDFTKARAYSNLGYLYTERGQWWRAEILCLRALKLFTLPRSEHGLAHTHNHLGILYTRQGKWDEAWEQFQLALTLWNEMEDLYGLLLANLNMGKLANDMVAEGIEPPENARSYLEQAIRYGEQSPDATMLAVAQMNLGIAHMLDRQFDQAVTYFQIAEKTFEHYEDTLALALIADNKGILLAEQRRLEQAQQQFMLALQRWRALPSRYGEIRTLFYLSNYSNGNGSEWIEQAKHLLHQHGHTGQFQLLAEKLRELERRI